MLNLLGQIAHTIGDNFYNNFLMDEMYILIVSKTFYLKGGKYYAHHFYVTKKANRSRSPFKQSHYKPSQTATLRGGLIVS